MIDDSALIHRAPYDPQKAREYYLRTRKLKGRRPAAPDSPGGRRPPKAEDKRPDGGRGTKPTAESRKEARAQAEQRLEDLRIRLDRLRNLLAERVEAAKKRSGIEDQTPNSGSDSKSKKSSSSKSGGSDSKPATAQEKREAAKRAKESYEKNKKLKGPKKEDPTIQQQIEKVEEQIRDIQKKLREAAATARKNSEAKSKKKTAILQDRRQ